MVINFYNNILVAHSVLGRVKFLKDFPYDVLEFSKKYAGAGHAKSELQQRKKSILHHT